MEASGRDKALDTALSQIKRRYGEGSIMKLGASHGLEVEVIPTGSLALDLALGVGGVPRGRVTEIYGPEASGKTTLAYHIVAEAQRMGEVAAFIDAEHAMDPAYAATCGVNVDELYISQPDTGEQGLEIAEALVRSGAIGVVVIDSVAALVPKAEIEGDMGDSFVGLQARLMSQALRKLCGAIRRSRTAVIFINQTRMRIGVLYGNPETTSGGTALKFYSSVRLEMRRVEAIKEGDKAIGNRVRVTVRKNKVARPFQQVELDIMFEGGISKEGGMLDVATSLGVVEKRGAYYSYGELRLGQGRESAKDFLKGNPEVAREIEQAVRERGGILAQVPADSSAFEVGEP